jgi:tetratricopeptide (TPR) repeat protein
VNANRSDAVRPRRRAGLLAWISPLVGLAVVAAVVWWFVFRESPTERGARLLTEAKAAMDSQDFATAETLLLEATKFSPQSALLQHNLGILYLQQDRLPEARAAFERAAAACTPEANKVRAEEYFQLANISYLERKPSQAADELEKASAADPAREQLHARLLDLQLGALADSAGAVATTERLLRDCGRTPRHLADVGYIHYQHRRYDTAVEMARAAVTLQDSLPQGHALLARSLWKLGHLPEGLRELEGPLQRYSNAPELWVTKSLLLLEFGRRTQALAAADRAVQLAPGDFEAHQARQKALAGSGRLQDARAEIQVARGLTQDPGQLRTLQRQDNILRALLAQTGGTGMLPSGGAADSVEARP